MIENTDAKNGNQWIVFISDYSSSIEKTILIIN